MRQHFCGCEECEKRGADLERWKASSIANAKYAMLANEARESCTRALGQIPMTADIAQIISRGYASGKTAAEIAEEIAREFDRDATAQDSDFESLLSNRRELTSLREKLATAQATYLQFCKKHDEREEKLREALQATLCELTACANQLSARGCPGHPEDSVSRAQKAARAALEEMC